MKSIKQLLELGDKRTQGEWECLKVPEDGYGCRDSYYSVVPKGAAIEDVDNYEVCICNNLDFYPQAVSPENQKYIASTPQMEAKLREMVDMLPTIKDLLSMLSGTYYGVNIDEFKEKLKKWEG